MTIYKPLERIVVEFTNRDGVPTSIIVEPDEEGYVEIFLDHDGLGGQLSAYTGFEGRSWRFKDRDEQDAPATAEPSTWWMVLGALILGAGAGAALTTVWFVASLATIP